MHHRSTTPRQYTWMEGIPKSWPWCSGGQIDHLCTLRFSRLEIDPNHTSELTPGHPSTSHSRVQQVFPPHHKQHSGRSGSCGRTSASTQNSIGTTSGEPCHGHDDLVQRHHGNSYDQRSETQTHPRDGKRTVHSHCWSNSCLSYDEIIRQSG